MSKAVFGFSKYSSVTAMLSQLGVPSFNTVLHNAKVGFCTRLTCYTGAVVDVLRCDTIRYDTVDLRALKS